MVDQTSQFYAILTNVGAAKQANADALGIAWKITQMGVGDANGSDPTPNATQTSLINEWRRAPLNQLKVDDNNSAIIIAEQVIPADVGGKWIREIALYDADGDMVAVANCAPTYKPLLSQGSGRTQVVRMNLVVSSASNVQLKIDPAVVLATREWVTEELARQDFKHSVVAATTANIALSGLQTVDGVALAAGARVLVKNQTAAKDNGLYQVAAGGAWTRCTDADTSSKVTPGMLVQVERGTVNGDSAWQLVTDSPISLGVTALAYEMAFGRTGVVIGTYRSVSVDAYGRVAAATNPSTVAGYGLTDVYTKTQVDSALTLRATLASPAFTGNPTAPTQLTGNNTTRLATTEFVQAAIAALVASSPSALDTLKELADALGNDPNFASTMSTQLGLKAPLASPDFTGTPTAPNGADGDSTTRIATTSFVQKTQGMAGWGQDGQVRANLGAGVDLNAIRVPGSYGQPLSANATLALNYPVATAGTLLVQAASTTITTQTFTQYNTGKTWVRAFYNTWSPRIESAAINSPTFTGIPKGPTPGRFDNTTQLATTAFVLSRGNQFGNIYKFTGNGTVAGVLAHVGSIVHFWGGDVMGYTLPDANSLGLPLGAVVRVHNWSTNSITLGVQGTNVMQASASAGTVTTLSIPPDTYVDAYWYGESTWALDGTGIDRLKLQWNRYDSTANGYARTPGGIIIQWGVVEVPQASNAVGSAGPTALVTMPLTFPGAPLRAFATMNFVTMSTNDAQAPGTIIVSNSQIRVQNNYTASAGSVCWFCIGY